MKIIIDDKIPYIKEAAEKIADEAIYAPGKDFTRLGGSVYTILSSDLEISSE